MDTEQQAQRLAQLPPEMLEFALLRTTGAFAPRLGRLSLPGRRPILTPNFIGATSRGVIPHISQDNFAKCLDLGGVYVALEDFIEKHPQQTPPIFQYDVPHSLRSFVALLQSTPLVLGARRTPPIPTPVPNTNTEISLLTSVGHRSMSADYYAAAVKKLQPDIVVGLPDIPFGQETVGTRRKDKMSDRTESWLKDLIAKKNAGTETGRKAEFAIFAPMLPVERDLQTWYLEHLVEDETRREVKGLAIYDAYSLDDVPDELQELPKLSFHAPKSPHELLRHVRMGIDVFTVPFISAATDAGIALDFTFPIPSPPADETAHPFDQRRELGTDMWDAAHATSLEPISKTCTCYTCTRHHRAYVQHLLSAKEMLGWTLLQIHNHAVISTFFSSIKDVLASTAAENAFSQHITDFESFYAPELPQKTGQGPRVRGYQFRSEDHAKTEKRNPKAYRKYTEDERTKLRLASMAAKGQTEGRTERMSEKDVVDDEALVGLVGLEENGHEAPAANADIAIERVEVIH